MNGETQFFGGRIEVGGEEARIFININCLQAFVDAVELHIYGCYFPLSAERIHTTCFTPHYCI